MLNTDPKRPLVRVVAVVAGLSVLGWGLAAILWRGESHYTNWLGELVFAPFAVLLGLAIILSALFEPEILGKSPARLKR